MFVFCVSLCGFALCFLLFARGDDVFVREMIAR